jgi:hypothetical protein
MDGRTSGAVGSSLISLGAARPSPLISYLLVEGSMQSDFYLLMTPPTLGACQGEVTGGFLQLTSTGPSSFRDLVHILAVRCPHRFERRTGSLVVPERTTCQRACNNGTACHYKPSVVACCATVEGFPEASRFRQTR